MNRNVSKKWMKEEHGGKCLWDFLQLTNSTYLWAGRHSNPWAAEMESRDSAGLMTIKERIEFCPTCGRNSGLLEREKYKLVCGMLTSTKSPLLSEYYLGKGTFRRPPLPRL